MRYVDLVIRPSTVEIANPTIPFDVSADFSPYRVVFMPQEEFKIRWTVTLLWPKPVEPAEHQALQLSIVPTDETLFAPQDFFDPVVKTPHQLIWTYSTGIARLDAGEYDYSIQIRYGSSGDQRLPLHKVDPILIISG
jgi:hypothetical protein